MMFMMQGDLSAQLAAVLPQVRRRADAVDLSGGWPSEDLRELEGCGVLHIAPPPPWGAGLNALEQHLIYEEVAQASLALSLIISQRDSAIGLIDGSSSPSRDSLLGKIADGAFTTVGIAQLTTSRQGGVPAVRARREGGDYRIEGSIPWCTGAAKADFIVAGAATEDGRQLLFVLRSGAAGVSIDPPLPLVALRSTWTSSVRCEAVRIGPADLLSGPAENVLIRANHLPLRQAYLATGLCRGGLHLIAAHRSSAAEAAVASFQSQLAELRQQIIGLSEPARAEEAAANASDIRSRCNDLAVRITCAAVALYKGTALLAGHPAQRVAREAMFLLVWSCPNPVIDCTVEMLSGRYC